MLIHRTVPATVFALLILLPTGVAMAYEEPGYSVVATVNGVEYRRYTPYLVAETRIAGIEDRDAAANLGFRRLFRYISGENVVRMVEQHPGGQASTKISMTAPVWQAPEPGGWRVAFVVPKPYSETNVPAPTDPEVEIRSVPGKVTAVWQYSGRWTDRVVEANQAELLGRLAESGVEPKGAVVTAYYNSPFTPPFLRRNEVMVEVSRVPAAE